MEIGDENRDPNLAHCAGGAKITTGKRTTNTKADGATRKNKAAKLEHHHESCSTGLALTFEVVDHGERFQLSVDDTVFGLMNAACEFWLTKRRRGDGGVYSHLWKVSDCESGRHYYGPDHFSTKKHETSNDSTPLRELMRLDSTFPVLSIEYDQGDTSYFQLEVVDHHEVDARTHAKLPRALPRVVEPVDSPILTAEEVSVSEAYRKRLSKTEETEYSPNQDCVIKANPHPWGHQEKQALSYLINAGVGFSKAWNQYLQHTLLFRSKGSTTGMYYQTKKRSAKYCDVSAREQRLHDAKRVLRNVRKQCLATPLRFAQVSNREEWQAAVWSRIDQSLPLLVPNGRGGFSRAV